MAASLTEHAQVSYSWEIDYTAMLLYQRETITRSFSNALNEELNHGLLDVD
ncbi:MAG: hypothetical protein QOD05_1762, partial [Microbacteriaceae bacterium]|nr:hypothetical protein [Microbacteriaceae bacterium]